METTYQRDERLWRIAKSRTRFRTHLIAYLIVSAFFWAIWFVTGRPNPESPWPVWPGLVWGMLVAFHYFYAWHRDPFGETLKEYERLQEERERRLV